MAIDRRTGLRDPDAQAYSDSIARDVDQLRQSWCGSAAPSSPTKGQHWYDTSTSQLKVYDGTTWQVIIFGSTVSGAFVDSAQIDFFLTGGLISAQLKTPLFIGGQTRATTLQAGINSSALNVVSITHDDDHATISTTGISGTKDIRILPAGALVLGAFTGYLKGASGTVSAQAVPIPIADGGSGQITANAALNAFLPSQTGNNGKVLQTDGSNTSWQAAGSGAPVGATYITQTPDATLTNEQALSALATGIVKVTTATGVLSSVAAPSGAIVGDTDAQTLSAKTLTAPVIDEIKDANGNRIALLTPIASAVNYFTIKNNIAGSSPQILAEGASANLNVNLIPKGTGDVMKNGTIIPTVSGAYTLTNKTIDGNNNTLTVLAGTQLSGATPIANGGTGQTAKTAAFNALSPNTTKGDVAVHNGTDNVRVPVGSDTQVLTADSSQASGVGWQNPTSGTTIPSGAMMPYAVRAAPAGWLLCDGAAVSRTTYSALFAAISPSIGTFTVTIASPAVATLTAHGLVTGDAVYLTTTGALPTGLTANTLYYVIKIDANTFNLATSRANADAGTKINTSGTQSGVHTLRFCPYGLGDGSTTFNVPDLRANVPVGLKSSDTSFDNIGETGGEKTHTLTTAEMPSHRHTLPNTKSGAVVEGNPGAAFGEMKYTNDTAAQTSAPTSTFVGSSGSDTAHQNMPPYQVFTYIIKT